MDSPRTQCKKTEKTLMKNRKGQILILHALGLFLLATLFLQGIQTAQALVQRQHENLAADLVALSAAQVEAEYLHFIGLTNQVMWRESQMILVSIATPFLLALSVFGLPYVPAATRLAFQVVRRGLKSLKRMNRLQKKLVKSYPYILTLYVHQMARENGFRSALSLPWPTLPVTENIEKFKTDILMTFVEFLSFGKISLRQKKYQSLMRNKFTGEKIKSFYKNSLSSNSLSKRLPDNEKIRKNKKNFSFLERQKRRFQKLLPSPHFLNENWKEDHINVICFTNNNEIRLATARVWHPKLSLEEDIDTSLDNNYLPLNGPKNFNGTFQPQLTYYRSDSKILDQLSKKIEILTNFLNRFPQLPLKQENFRLIQH
jgi:hypothetical protein